MSAFPPPHLARYRSLLQDYDDFVEALARPLPQTIAVNHLRLDAASLREALQDRVSLTPIDWFPGAFRLHEDDRPGRDWTFPAGLYTVQEEASLMPVRMLAVEPGHRVLDLCAAPGNKTVQLALALGNRGTLIANDLKVARLTALHDVCRRLGVLNVSTTGHDGAVYPVDDAQFDRILVDAPCTAEGKARRGYLRDSSPTFRRWINGQQRALLLRAAALCRPGGRLVYATCTFAPEENEAVVSDVLEALDGRLRAVPVAFEVPGASPGLSHFGDRRFHEDLRHARRLWPHRADTGGFFAVALERIDDGPTRAPRTASLPPAVGRAVVDRYLERFALPASALDALHFFEGPKHLRAVCADHELPAGIAFENHGLDVARRRSALPKLTTAAAMAIGSGAGRNCIDLDSDEFARWRAREDLALPAARLGILDRGYLLVRHGGLVQGTGFLRLDEAENGLLESQFPKAWMRTART
ncbi:MAG: RsmB/NOP family class I SAM-dependent RNA methyltransferase [Pseudomonadales bacterium]|jgi:16S rRNA C967 or C1407 C5-methylase (RsmB/RsmF family)/NOL1/NOP2/fmu family ribosome biogenesis protein|nr:RsmB/NOP family class I SAM-dependent RNA methyltransferase [Pseudomonadales bacterium]